MKISEKLLISPLTVNAHVHSILGKKAVRGKIQAAVKAVREELV